MAFTVGVGPVTALNGASSSTITLNLNGTTAGRHIIVGYVCNYNNSATSITCSGESNLTLIGSPHPDSLSGSAVQLAYLANNTAGGNKTITVNLSFNDYTDGASAFAIEFAGGDAASFLDVSNSADALATVNPTVSQTTTADGDLIVGITAAWFNSGGETTPSGYTDIPISDTSTTPTRLIWAAYKLDAGAAGSKATTWTTVGASDYWTIYAASFKADNNAHATPAAGSLSFTGNAPEVGQTYSFTPDTGTLSLTGYAPLVDVGAHPFPQAGSLSFTGYAPTVTYSGHDFVPAQGSLSFTGYAPTVEIKVEKIPTTGVLAFSGSAPTVNLSTYIELLLRTVSATGIAETFIGLPLRTIEAYGVPDFSAEFNLPRRSINATGVGGNVTDVTFSAPLRTIYVTANDGASFATPLRTVDASGVMGGTAAVIFSEPLRALSSIGIPSFFGNASFSMWLRNLSSTALSGTTATISFISPLRDLSSTSFSGVAASVAFSLLLREIEGSGYTQLVGNASFKLPLRYLGSDVASAIAEHYRAWVMNARTGDLTEYDNFSFNSVVRFGTRYIASGPNGLFLLGGNDDNGTQIASVLRTGLNDYDNSMLKRVPRIYISEESDGDLYFSTISTEDGKRTYSLMDNGMRGEQMRRIPIGKGPKSVRWQFEVTNRNGSNFGVSKIIVYPENLRRRNQ